MRISLKNRIDQLNKKAVPGISSCSGFRLITRCNRAMGTVRGLATRSMRRIHPNVFICSVKRGVIKIPRVALGKVGTKRRVGLHCTRIGCPSLPHCTKGRKVVVLRGVHTTVTRSGCVAGKKGRVVTPEFACRKCQFVRVANVSGSLPLRSIGKIILDSVSKLTSGCRASGRGIGRL